jgi:hypothetical protein
LRRRVNLASLKNRDVVKLRRLLRHLDWGHLPSRLKLDIIEPQGTWGPHNALLGTHISTCLGPWLTHFNTRLCAISPGGLPTAGGSRPAGKAIATIEDLVLNLVVSPDRRIVVATYSGYLPHGIDVFDTRSQASQETRTSRACDDTRRSSEIPEWLPS